MRWVVDASIAVEVLLRSRLGKEAWKLVERGELLAPDLIDAEVLSVLRREVMTDRLGERRARQALDDLQAWGIRRVPNALLLREAWTHRHNVSGYDALYLAAARVADATVITADGPLSRAPAVGVPVHNLRR